MSQAPDGFLQSEFIAPVVEQHLRYAKNSVLHPCLDAADPPKGLYILILAAVCHLDSFPQALDATTTDN
jgi:hypothetical protein